MTIASDITVRHCTTVLKTNIDQVGWDQAITRIAEWARIRESRYVCMCNVHSVVSAMADPEVRDALNNADMATPDGAPVAWAVRRIEQIAQERISGPDLMWKVMLQAQAQGLSVFFYGSTPTTLGALRNVVERQFPGLAVVGDYSPPFRPMTASEDADVVERINGSGANIVFVGLGCPKQELWMAAHRQRVDAVMLGVGAAFDYHAGTIKRAPLIWQRHGLEWLYRLRMEPRRLLRRYMVTNSVFIVGFSWQLLRKRKLDRRSPRNDAAQNP